MEYAIVIAALSKKDGGGFAGYVPDLPGCMSDGESHEEALANTRLAIHEWIETAKKLGRKIPQPGSAKKRYLQERKTLIKAAADAVELLSSLEERIERLSDDIKEIQETQANYESWTRFSEITKLPLPTKRGKKADAAC